MNIDQDTFRTVEDIYNAYRGNDNFIESICEALYWAHNFRLTVQDFKSLSPTHSEFVELLQKKVLYDKKVQHVEEDKEEGEVLDEDEEEEGEVIEDGDNEKFNKFSKKCEKVERVSDVGCLHTKVEDKENACNIEKEGSCEKKVDLKRKNDGIGIESTKKKQKMKESNNDFWNVEGWKGMSHVQKWEICDESKRIVLCKNSLNLRERLKRDENARNMRANRM